MNRNTALLIVIWNVVLTALLGWLMLRSTDAPLPTAGTDTPVVEAMIAPRDSTALKDARIAFFFMDSIQTHYELVKESADRVRGEGRKLEEDLAREMRKAQERVQQLASKDPTYSTKAEMQADQEEYQRLQMQIQEQRDRSQQRIDELQIKALEKITEEIIAYLEEYNRTAGFDYIFSVQDGGQIWVGNTDLDITNTILTGLNERHRAAKNK